VTNNGTVTESQTRRAAIRQLREEQELHRLQRAKLRESWDGTDTIGNYIQTLTQEFLNWQPIGGIGTQGRRAGRNWPVYTTEAQLKLLREGARALTATNGYAIGLKDAICSYVVGTGFTYSVNIKGEEYAKLSAALQDVVDGFLLRNQWGGNDSGEIKLRHAVFEEGEQPSLEEEFFYRTMTDGEVFAASFPHDDGTTDIRLVEPDQVTLPPSGVEFTIDGERHVTSGDFAEWGFGIFAAKNDAQRPLAYWAQWGDSRSDGDVIGPDRMCHVRVNSWRTSKRGVPDFAFDTLDALKLANSLRGNMGEAAAQQASIVGVRQHATGTQDEIQSFNDSKGDYQRTNPSNGNLEWIKNVVRGRWEDVPEGLAYVKAPEATNAAAHIQVLQALLRAAAVRWCGTEWLASGDSSNNNYASSLVANNHFVIAVKRRQKALRSAMGMLVARAVRHWVRTHGGITAGGTRYSPEIIDQLASINVTVPAPESADPLALAQRFAIERQNGVIDPITWAEKVGHDPDQIARNMAKWKELNPGEGVPLAVPPGFGG
jgi:hypothetical protein